MKKGRKLDYYKYIHKYYEKQEQMKARGLKMNDKMYSKQEFEAMHKALSNDRRKEIKEGKRKTQGDVTRDLINRQAYAITLKQAKVRKKALQNMYENRLQTATKAEISSLKKILKNLNLFEIRANLKAYETDWAVVSNRRQQLLDSGMNSTDASVIISQEFFGS